MTIQVSLPSAWPLGSPPYIFCLLLPGRLEVSQERWGGRGLGQEVGDSWGWGDSSLGQPAHTQCPSYFSLCLWYLTCALGTLAASSWGVLRMEFILLYEDVS